MKGISVIIPTYNRENLVGEAIKSVVSQNYPGKIEIIISDDGSTDLTLEVAASYGPKVKILKKPHDCKTQGASGARNRGILKATQPYICFLDSDDFYLPDHLNRMALAIESDHSLGFAICNSLEIWGVNRENKFRRWTKKNINTRDIKNLSISTTQFAHTNVFIFKKEVFQKVGLFDENIQVGEDSDMWMRINEHFKGIYSDHYGSVRRIHDMHQLTDIPKNSLLKSHYNVYRNAIKRFHAQGLSDRYRLSALWFLTLKYKLSQWPIFNSIYIMVSHRNNRKKLQILHDTSCQPLEFFEDYERRKKGLDLKK